MLHKLQQYRDRMDYGTIEVDTKSQKYKILNHKYKEIHDSSSRN